jgi:hypothetical protein
MEIGEKFKYTLRAGTMIFYAGFGLKEPQGIYSEI